MKKLFSLILIVALLTLTLAGCAHFYKSDYALMIGISTSQSLTSQPPENPTEFFSEVTHTVAAIVIDKDYKIVSCRIDCISVKAALDAEGNVFAADSRGNKLEAIKSKAELGSAYGMLTNSPYYGSSLAEWDDQAKAFETYVKGKTREEVKNINTKDETLLAGCTIGVTDFMKAIDNAFASNHMVGMQTKGDITLGVAASAKVSKSENSASYTADFSAVALVDGKVLGAVIDSKEVTSKISADGKFDKIKDSGSKLEKGDNYGMVAYGNAIAEWYEQAQAFADTAKGKTVSELAGLATEGVAGCTIYAGGYKSVLEKAASYAR